MKSKNPKHDDCFVTHVIDCGANSATLYTVETDTVETIKLKDVLNLPDKLPKGSFVVSEFSHLGCERTEFSLSQPFTRDLLLGLYQDFEEKGIKFRLFPQKSTPRACAHAGLGKSDSNDPKSIYILMKDFPKIVDSLMKPPKTFDLNPIRAESYEFVKYTNMYINKARREKPKYFNDQCSRKIRKWLDALASSMSDTAKDCFGLTDNSKYVTSRKGEYKKGDWKMSDVKIQALYAIACTIIHPDADVGPLRLRAGTETLPGWAFIKRYVFKMTPYHLKGGVARSNLYYHGMRNWIIAKAQENEITLRKKSRGGFFENDGKTKRLNSQFTPKEDAFFVAHRKMYCDAIREAWQTFRDFAKAETVLNVGKKANEHENPIDSKAQLQFDTTLQNQLLEMEMVEQN